MVSVLDKQLASATSTAYFMAGTLGSLIVSGSRNGDTGTENSGGKM